MLGAHMFNLLMHYIACTTYRIQPSILMSKLLSEESYATLNPYLYGWLQYVYGKQL
jgi:hypothetical protein